MLPYSLYLHVPFCVHRCAYCDFNTYAGMEALMPGYVRAICQEAAYLSATAGERLPVHTVFFGGGTPSLLPLAGLEQILAALAAGFDLLPGVEITLEANPGTLSLDYLRGLRSLGVNRLSLGMQSANAAELRLLERQHDLTDVIRAVSWARRAGLDNLNLDLIFGLPGQALDPWRHTLETALALRPTHLSLYALTLEHGTPMQRWVGRGLMDEPDADLAAEMYEYASQRLEQAGLLQYEISNWAFPDGGGQPLACRHNLQYWRNLPYLGLGAGAHGYVAGVRTANVLAPAAYIQRLSPPLEEGFPISFPHTPATTTLTPIDRQAEIGETMMMGLRLVREGVPAAGFEQRFGESLQSVFGPVIARLEAQGLLEWANGQQRSLRLTVRGRLLGNRVFMEFI